MYAHTAAICRTPENLPHLLQGHSDRGSLLQTARLGRMQIHGHVLVCRSHVADCRVRTQRLSLQRALSGAYEPTYLFEASGRRYPQV